MILGHDDLRATHNAWTLGLFNHKYPNGQTRIPVSRLARTFNIDYTWKLPYIAVGRVSKHGLKEVEEIVSTFIFNSHYFCRGNLLDSLYIFQFKCSPYLDWARSSSHRSKPHPTFILIPLVLQLHLIGPGAELVEFGLSLLNQSKIKDDVNWLITGLERSHSKILWVWTIESSNRQSWQLIMTLYFATVNCFKGPKILTISLIDCLTLRVTSWMDHGAYQSQEVYHFWLIA